MSRLMVSCHSEQSIPSWSGFKQLLAQIPPKATIGYSPPITAPFIEADQAIYSELLDVMFKMFEDST